MNTKQVQVINGCKRAPTKEEKDVEAGYWVSFCNKTHSRRYLVNFLLTVVGMGSCVGLNGLGSELPLLVITAPEGPALAANLAMVVVVSYLAPMVYALFHKSTTPINVRYEFIWISAALVICSAASGLLAFFYNVTVTIKTLEYSVVLCTYVFTAGTVSGARNVLIMPYLRHFEEAHLTSFFIGENLSGFVPSVVALIQGVGGEPVCSPSDMTNSTDPSEPYISPPNFSIRQYFLFVSTLLALSTLSFWCLEYLRVKSPQEKNDATFRREHADTEENNSSEKLLDEEFARKTRNIEITKGADMKLTKPTVAPGNSIGNGERIYLCGLMGLVCCIAHGYLNNMEIYSSRPYGNSVYHLVANISQLSGTIACALAYWLRPLGTRGITVIMVFICIGTAHVTWLGLSSPNPIWRDTTYGVWILIIIWVILISSVSYVKLAITTIVWQEGNDVKVLNQVSSANLLGTITGAVFIFYIVNFTALLTPYDPCELHR